MFFKIGLLSLLIVSINCNLILTLCNTVTSYSHANKAYVDVVVAIKSKQHMALISIQKL